MLKRKIFVSALAICLVAIISMGTLAWFSDNDEVTNKFMIAGSENDDPTEIFSVDVYEVDEDGNQYDYDDVAQRVDDGMTFDNVLPGGTYAKNATVKNTGSYSEYVRVQVTISDKNAWQASVGLENNLAGFEAYNTLQHFNGFDQSKWQWDKTKTEYGVDSITYTLYLKDPLAAGTEIKTFESITLPTTMEREDAVLFNDDNEAGFTVKVRADAVQSDGGIADNCYDAFVAAYGVNA